MQRCTAILHELMTIAGQQLPFCSIKLATSVTFKLLLLLSLSLSLSLSLFLSILPFRYSNRCNKQQVGIYRYVSSVTDCSRLNLYVHSTSHAHLHGQWLMMKTNAKAIFTIPRWNSCREFSNDDRTNWLSLLSLAISTPTSSHDLHYIANQSRAACNVSLIFNAAVCNEYHFSNNCVYCNATLVRPLCQFDTFFLRNVLFCCT